MAKIWVAVKSGLGVEGLLASTSLAEVSRGLGCSVWTLRRLRREIGEEGFVVNGEGGLPWWVVRVELRRVEGRGKMGKSGYRLKSG